MGKAVPYFPLDQWEEARTEWEDRVAHWNELYPNKQIMEKLKQRMEGPSFPSGMFTDSVKRGKPPVDVQRFVVAYKQNEFKTLWEPIGLSRQVNFYVNSPQVGAYVSKRGGAYMSAAEAQAEAMAELEARKQIRENLRNKNEEFDIKFSDGRPSIPYATWTPTSRRVIPDFVRQGIPDLAPPPAPFVPEPVPPPMPADIPEPAEDIPPPAEVVPIVVPPELVPVKKEPSPSPEPIIPEPVPAIDPDEQSAEPNFDQTNEAAQVPLPVPEPGPVLVPMPIPQEAFAGERPSRNLPRVNYKEPSEFGSQFGVNEPDGSADEKAAEPEEEQVSQVQHFRQPQQPSDESESMDIFSRFSQEVPHEPAPSQLPGLSMGTTRFQPYLDRGRGNRSTSRMPEDVPGRVVPGYPAHVPPPQPGPAPQHIVEKTEEQGPVVPILLFFLLVGTAYSLSQR